MKKSISFVLCVVLLCSFCMVAQAAPSQHEPYLNDEFITPEMVERDKEIVAEMIEKGKSISRTRASKTLNVTLLYQNPTSSDIGDWTDTYMPCNECTYGRYGCAITCYAMTAKYYGITSLNTPPKFGQRYYDEYDIYPCDQNVSDAASLMGKTKQATDNLTQQNTIYFCVAAINANKPVVIRTDKGGSHYVLAYGYNGNTIYIRDPEKGYSRTTLQQYFADSEILEMASIG